MDSKSMCVLALVIAAAIATGCAHQPELCVDPSVDTQIEPGSSYIFVGPRGFIEPPIYYSM